MTLNLTSNSVKSKNHVSQVFVIESNYLRWVDNIIEFSQTSIHIQLSNYNSMVMTFKQTYWRNVQMKFNIPLVIHQTLSWELFHEHEGQLALNFLTYLNSWKDSWSLWAKYVLLRLGVSIVLLLEYSSSQLLIDLGKYPIYQLAVFPE